MINEHKKGTRAKIYLKHTKPATNPVAKAAQSVAKGSGEHKNPKTAVKQPRKAKHKKAEVMESVLYVVENDMTDFFKNLQQTDPKFKNLRVHGDPEHDQLRQQDAEKRQQDQASRKAQGEKDAQARIEQDRGNLPQLKDQLAQLTAEYKRYGGDSWQYADRMTDNDRKAQSLGQQVHSLQSRIAKAEQGVAEAGNKPLEKSRFGTGDTRTPRDIKSQMSGASDEFVKSTADKTTGPFHSKVAKMQGKMAKSELRKREQGVAEGDREFRNQERNAGLEPEDNGTYSIWTQGSKDDKPKSIITKQCSMDDAERHARSIKKKYPFLKVWMQAHHLGKGGFFPMNEDSWSDGQGEWTSQHDQWTKESVEQTDTSEEVYGAIIRRIIGAHASLLGQYGPDRVMAAARDVADWNNDVEEIGTSDVSGWVRQVFQKLQNNEY